jgi:hypothetical protein
MSSKYFRYLQTHKNGNFVSTECIIFLRSKSNRFRINWQFYDTSINVTLWEEQMDIITQNSYLFLANNVQLILVPFFFPPVWNRLYNSRFFFLTQITINATRWYLYTHARTHTHTRSCYTAITARDDCKCFTSRLPWSLLAATTRARKSLARTSFPSEPVACESLLGRSQVSTTLTLTLPNLLVAKVARPLALRR